RRHTRSDRDWSSDVCSSDLRLWKRVAKDIVSSGTLLLRLGAKFSMNFKFWKFTNYRQEVEMNSIFVCDFHALTSLVSMSKSFTRSEERRVGKECSYRVVVFH